MYYLDITMTDDIDADELIRLVKELLNELGENIDPNCKCNTYLAVAEFASKIIKMGVYIEASKIQRMKELFGL